MSSAKGKRLALVRRCIEDEKNGLLYKYCGSGFHNIDILYEGNIQSFHHFSEVCQDLRRIVHPLKEGLL